ncbi:MAG: alpha-amylase [Treponema sp.]|jgi:hypothetical protein|nr:alpha-amylase [Treponema sp.]
MSGAKINLILGSHAHVPSGAEEYEFENVYEKILRPFVSTLCKYPKIQAVLHYSGILLYWVERFRPELFMLIEDMVSRKQAELLGGGFYEPMLPLIPLQDRIGQIELLTTYLRKHFGKRPQGCWIPALAWEQHLVSPLAACGMAYTFLGENQFLLAGLGTEDLFAPCISEDQGKLITIFPISQSTGAALAEKNISLVLEELQSRLPPHGEQIVSVFPERLASSSGETLDYTWNRFFEELSLCESQVECLSPAKLLKGLRGLKKASFPDSVGFITGLAEDDSRISPRRFLIEHPEANGVYAKMIFTSVLINQLRGDKSRKLCAREELWKAHGCDLFYSAGTKQYGRRHSMRKAAYRSLIDAERITREKRKFTPSLIQFDFDFDGVGEYLFQDMKLNCYIQLTGAGIFELDYIPKTWNYLDAGSVEEAGRDPLRRTAFADYLLPASVKTEDLLRVPLGHARVMKGTRLCFTEKYEAMVQDRSKGKVCFTLPAAPSLPFGDIEITKCFSLKRDVLTVSYSLANRGKERGIFRFVPEINLSFANEGEEFVRFFICKSGDKDAPLSESGGTLIKGADGLKIQDLKNEVQINLASTKSFDGCLAPVRIGTQYQAACIMPLFDISLGSGETWANDFSLKFSH